MLKAFDVGNLPSLNALRAFVLVAANGSVKRAAEIIHVTPSAVTHQVRSLEATLGMQLFTRDKNKVILSPEGESLYVSIHGAFTLIACGLSEVCYDNSEILRISTLPTLAQCWLAKRLPRFHKLHPNIQIDIHTSIKLVDFSSQNADVAIRLGRGVWSGLRSWKLMDEISFPICSPEFLHNHGDGISMENLTEDLMISIRHRPDDWALWRKCAKLPDMGPINTGYVFENSALALEAARHGVGVAIGRSTLVMDDLFSGALLRLSTHSCQLNNEAYWLCCPEAYANKPEIVAFRRWLEAECPLGAFKPLPQVTDASEDKISEALAQNEAP